MLCVVAHSLATRDIRVNDAMYFWKSMFRTFFSFVFVGNLSNSMNFTVYCCCCCYCYFHPGAPFTCADTVYACALCLDVVADDSHSMANVNSFKISISSNPETNWIFFIFNECKILIDEVVGWHTYKVIDVKNVMWTIQFVSIVSSMIAKAIKFDFILFDFCCCTFSWCSHTICANAICEPTCDDNVDNQKCIWTPTQQQQQHNGKSIENQS